MSSQSVRVVASGRVQGVNFRWTLREACEARRVDGWVRNRPDGTVEAFLQGPGSDVESIIDWMRAGGPRGGRVDSLDVQPQPQDDTINGFEILRD